VGAAGVASAAAIPATRQATAALLDPNDPFAGKTDDEILELVEKSARVITEASDAKAAMNGPSYVYPMGHSPTSNYVKDFAAAFGKNVNAELMKALK